MKCSWSSIFQIFVKLTRSGDICDQSRKLSIRPPKFCWGQPFLNLYPRYYAYLAARRLVKFPGVIATSPKVIGTLVLNFKPNFKCSHVNFWRTPCQLGCALASLGQSLVRVKIWGASIPWRPKCSLPKKSTWVGQHNYRPNFLVSGPNFNFLAQCMMACNWSTGFPIFVMSILSGDICDQSRKLSKIAPNFGRFLKSKFCWGWVSQKLYKNYQVFLPARRVVKFYEVTPTIPKGIGAHTLNFKHNFKISLLIFLGDLRPGLGCALASLGQSLAHVKIWGASTP